MSLVTADPVRQALAARAVLGWLAGRHPEDTIRMLADLTAMPLTDDIRDMAEETVALARDVQATGGA